MSDNIFKDIKSIFEIRDNTTFEFKEICGFTFVFKTQILILRNKVSSAEIKPVGIIYEEKGEFYFAPLGRAGDIDEIVREYVKKETIGEEEYPHFPQ